VTQALIDVSADGRYQLYVNGEFVGRGPSRCSSSWQTYDTHDIRPYLRTGTNVVAALVHSYGRDCSWYELPKWRAAMIFGCGGWFVQGSVIATDGQEVSLDTDASWRHSVSSAWKKDTPNNFLGFTEDYDARKAPKGWQAVGFDDTAWEPAQVLRFPGLWGSNDTVPFPIMVPRTIPYPLEEEHWPASIVQYGEVATAAGAASIKDAFEAEEIEPLSGCRVQGIESIVEEAGEAEILTTPGRSVTVVLDFGKTQQGRVRFAVEGRAGSIVDFCYTERLRPDGRVHIPPWGWGPQDHVCAHRVTLDDGPLTWEQFDFGGFRYVQMTFRNCTEPLKVKSVAVNYTSYPVEYRGKFECSDPLLNDIYRISGYTLQCCMLDSYEDCPSREQRQWTNDQYVHLMSNYGLFGDPHLARQLLVQVAQSQREDGQVMMCAPGDFATTHTMNMPGFTLHWIMSIPQYVRYTGDASILHELYPSVVKGLAWFERHLDEEDLLNEVPGALWIDWAEIDKKGQMTELNARFVGCLRIASQLAARLGYTPDVTRFSALADRISAAINTHLWDEERGVYVDARSDGVQSRRVSQESSTAAMFFGVAPRERWSRCLEYILDDSRLLVTPPCVDWGRSDPRVAQFDEERNVVVQHAFYMHFLHAVLAELGCFEDIANNIRRWWGPQVEAGAETWWEHWDLDWETAPSASLCHAFMCTPGFDLPSYVLGVTPLEYGFSRFQIAPQPVDLAWVKGVFPSIKGDISISTRWQGDDLVLDLQVPAGTEAEIVMPAPAGKQLAALTLDGVRVALDRVHVGAGAHSARARYEPL
jgi:hypothetical protein